MEAMKRAVSPRVGGGAVLAGIFASSARFSSSLMVTELMIKRSLVILQ